MDRRIVLGGLALCAFAVTLALTSGREMLAPATELVSPVPVPALKQDSIVQTAPSVPAPASLSPDTPIATPPPTATTPPAALTAPLDTSPTQSEYEQNINPGVDIEAMRRDRGVQHTPEPN